MNANTSSPSPNPTLAYGLLALPLSLIGLTFYVVLPKFYADVIGVNLAALSGILIISRIWDAVIDPLVGNLSDRYSTPWGRRRPWIFLASFPLGLTFFLLTYPALCPQFMSQGNWYAVLSILFFLFWTFVSVPYEALGTELTFDFHGRTKLLGVRDGLTALGTLLAAIFPLLVAYLLPQLGKTASSGLIGAFYGLILVLCACWCTSKIREHSWDISQRPNHSLLTGARQVLKNKPFRILLFAYTIGAFGAELPATLLLFYVQYVLKSEYSQQFLGLYLFVGLLFIPFWIKLSRSLDKKRTWLCGMLINTGAFAGVFFLGAGDQWLYAILVVFSAIGYGATLVIPSSMQADVVDYDEMLNGKRNEGQFIGFWSLAKKLVRALGAGLSLWALDLAGYVPNGEQPESALFAMSLFYAGIPCICNFLSMAVAWKYPIDQEMYREIRRKIEERAQL